MTTENRAPPEGTFTNHGGMSRYQVTGPTTETVPDQHRVSASLVGGVLRATSSGGSVTEESTGSLSRASSRDLLPSSSDGPVFTSPLGRALMASEITPQSLVSVGGVTTNVRA